MGHLKQVDGTRCKLPLEWRNANIESFSLSQHDSYWARRWEMRKSTDRVRKRDLETRKEKAISARVIVERVFQQRQELNTDDHAIR